ncbi:POK9 protein, partial [Serilophus lunatus]|nr:POK9 protein [Serilophus lunatus]
IDLAAAVDVTLITTAVHKIPIGVRGPIVHIKSKTGALWVGRSSTGLAGLVVLPGVIDADFMGEIQIMAYAIQPPLTTPKGTRIAQLVLIEALHDKAQATTCVRGEGGFGSSGGVLINLAQQMKRRPLMDIELQIGTECYRIARVTTDTGADCTI